jgi:hypothetical protein
MVIDPLNGVKASFVILMTPPFYLSDESLEEIEKIFNYQVVESLTDPSDLPEPNDEKTVTVVHTYEFKNPMKFFNALNERLHVIIAGLTQKEEIESLLKIDSEKKYSNKYPNLLNMSEKERKTKLRGITDSINEILMDLTSKKEQFSKIPSKYNFANYIVMKDI